MAELRGGSIINGSLTVMGTLVAKEVVEPSVVAIYRSMSGTVLAGPGIYTIVDYNVRNEDSHLAVTTGASWRFTAPVAGVYSVAASIFVNQYAQTAGDVFLCTLFKGGVHFEDGNYYTALGPVTQYVDVTLRTAVRLAAGEYIDIRGYNSTASGKALYSADGAYSQISIVRLGS